MVDVTSDVNSTAGEVFSLECVVMTVEGVSPPYISITWTGPNGPIPSGDHIEIEKLTTADSVAVGRLVFSPLYTSDRGEYSCTGRISVDNVGVDVSNDSNIHLNVTSKPLIFIPLIECSPRTMHILSPSPRSVDLSKH